MDTIHITQEADYAIRIIFCLASNGRKTGAREISEKMHITLRFTLKILRKLIIGGIAKSFKGVNGGYVLSKPDSEISMGEIIEIIDGPINISRCIGGNVKCNRNVDKNDCEFHKYFIEINAIVKEKLENIKIKDCCKNNSN